MPRVTIVTSKGTERMPAKQAALRIEAGDATLDESDVRGCRAMAAFTALRMRPLLVPKTEEAAKPAAPAKRVSRKTAGKKTVGKKTTKTRAR